MSLHKYLFANSNPVKYCDPSGHSAFLTELGATMAIGAILSGVAYGVCWGIAATLDSRNGTNYSSSYSAGGLIGSIVAGALLAGIGWEFSVFFASLGLTALQYFEISIICAIICYGTTIGSQYAGNSGNPILSGF